MTKKHLKVVTIIVSLAIVFCSLTVNADTEPMDTEVIQEGYTSDRGNVAGQRAARRVADN